MGDWQVADFGLFCLCRRRSQVVRQESVSLREMSRRDTKHNMYFVYFLKSLKNLDLYIGSTENIEQRLERHNGGRVKSTKPYRPWQLLDFEVYNSRGEAVRREKFLKTSQQKELLKIKYGLVAKW